MGVRKKCDCGGAVHRACASVPYRPKAPPLVTTPDGPVVTAADRERALALAAALSAWWGVNNEPKALAVIDAALAAVRAERDAWKAQAVNLTAHLADLAPAPVDVTALEAALRRLLECLDERQAPQPLGHGFAEAIRGAHQALAPGDVDYGCKRPG